MKVSTRFSIAVVVTLVALSVSSVLLPHSIAAQDSGSTSAIVTAWALNLRDGPGIEYRILDILSRGEKIELVGYRNGDATWLLVQTQVGVTGWARARYLHSDLPFEDLEVMTDPQAGGPTATVTAAALNVRRGPGTSYAVIGWLEQGQQVELAGYRNADASWVQIRMPSGVTGWVSARYLRSDYSFTNLAVQGGAGDNLGSTQPEQVVESFFSWYLEYARYTGNPLVDRAYRTQTHLTADFIRRLDRMVDAGMQADPLLLAQDVPGAMRIVRSKIDGTTAWVLVDEIWNPSTAFETSTSISVVLRQGDSQWKIDDVQSGQKFP